MKLSNTTPYPALAFEGLDQLGQSFHVVVMRQTYTWNENGLLIVADEQDPLRFEDQLADPNDVMSGILEESDLAHYKPRCDVIIKGHAYAPKHRQNQDSFTASIKLQSPDTLTLAEPIAPNKYIFNEKASSKQASEQYSQGQTLINKTLAILSPRHVIAGLESLTGKVSYRIKSDPMPDKVSLNPSSSFGGYCLIEEDHLAIRAMDKDELIPKQERESIRLNPHHGTIAYLEEDPFNPAGRGYTTPSYQKAMKSQRIELSQIHHPDMLINDNIINQMSRKPLDKDTHTKLVVGFGVRNKSHPDRSKLIGKVDQDFIDSGKAYPPGFDFAMWNCAYPDQQTDYLQGNEWLTLTNLCHQDTKAATINKKGDIELKIYLPEALAYLELESSHPQLMGTELPMHLDTVIVSPDEQKVHLVWRSMVISDYQPKKAVLKVMNRQQIDKIKTQYFTQTRQVVRPYESK